jgi:hypothetical protein
MRFTICFSFYLLHKNVTDGLIYYDAENRFVYVTGAATANFVYDGDGKPLGRACRDQVKTIVDGVTTYYVGSHYEVKNGVVTKYYFAGTTRLAVRTGGALSYLLSDHLGSSSVTMDANVTLGTIEHCNMTII